MPVPSPRSKLLPARGNYSDLATNVAELLDGEICYAIDQDQYYQKEGSILVSVGATKAQGLLADTAVQPGDLATVATSGSYNDLTDKPSIAGGGAELTFTITASGTTDYLFSGNGFTAPTPDPTLTLVRGQTYRFNNTSGLHPFQIQSTQGQGGTPYADGVTGNNTIGEVVFVVPFNAPNTLYYQCTAHPDMNGTLQIITAGGGGGASAIGDLSDVDTTSSAPTDGQALVWSDADSEWVPGTVSGGGGIGEAPTDGKLYGRINTTWSEVDTDYIVPAVVNNDPTPGDTLYVEDLSVGTTNGDTTYTSVKGYEWTAHGGEQLAVDSRWPAQPAYLDLAGRYRWRGLNSSAFNTPFGTAPFEVSFWWRLSSTDLGKTANAPIDVNMDIFQLGTGALSDKHPRLQIGSDGNYTLEIGNNTWEFAPSTGAPTYDTDYYLTILREGDDIFFMVNGVVAYSNSLSAGYDFQQGAFDDDGGIYPPFFGQWYATGNFAIPGEYGWFADILIKAGSTFHSSTGFTPDPQETAKLGSVPAPVATGPGQLYIDTTAADKPLYISTEADTYRKQLSVDSSIAELADVDSNMSPNDGETLVYNSGTWEAAAPSGVANLDELGDVDLDTTAPASNQLLGYDGTNWVPVNRGSGTASFGSGPSVADKFHNFDGYGNNSDNESGFDGFSTGLNTTDQKVGAGCLDYSSSAGAHISGYWSDDDSAIWIEFWAKHDGVNLGEQLIFGICGEYSSSYNGRNGIYIRLNEDVNGDLAEGTTAASNHRIIVGPTRFNSSAWVYTTDMDPCDNQWHHYAVAIDPEYTGDTSSFPYDGYNYFSNSGVVRLYVDGQLKMTNETGSKIDYRDLGSYFADQCTIVADTSNNYAWRGMLDNLRIFTSTGFPTLAGNASFTPSETDAKEALEYAPPAKYDSTMNLTDFSGTPATSGQVPMMEADGKYTPTRCLELLAVYTTEDPINNWTPFAVDDDHTTHFNVEARAGQVIIDAYNWIWYTYTGPYDAVEDAGGWLEVTMAQPGGGAPA